MSRQRAVLLAGLVLLVLTAVPSSATFSGPDGQIVFSRFVASSETVELFSANPDGTALKRLTRSGAPERASFLSDWSPDGESIAFDSDRVDADDRRNVVQIYLMNADGTGEEQLTRGRGFHGSPGFSPDGESLAIDADWGAPETNGLWIIPTDDPNGVTIVDADRVTDPPDSVEFDSEPQFSPDGGSLVFTRFKSPRRSAIYTVDSDGDDLTRLTTFKLNASDPDWAPDGNRIVFDSGDSGRPGTKGDIHVMDPDGSDRQRLTDTPRNKPDRIKAAQNPVWSPSGERIMFTRFVRRGTKLKVMNANGSNQRNVLDLGGFPNKVDWGVHPPVP
jgi:Tol biopolymer transport system component